jgi:gallate dioxygenase
LILEDQGHAKDEELLEHRRLMTHQLAGVEKIEGTHPFTLDVSNRSFRLNDFLHRLIIPEHRERFLNDTEALYDEFSLTDEERSLIDARDWIGLIHYGVIFFCLEKMAAVVGVSNPEVYAQMRGETLEEYLKTRNVGIQYSVAGGDRAQEIADKTD